MRRLILFILTLSCQFLWAQTFPIKQRLLLPAIKSTTVQWADLDNDGLLDVVIAGKSAGKISILFYVNKSADSLSFNSTLPTDFTSGMMKLKDINQDNRVDIILSGTLSSGNGATIAFINLGNFQFSSGQTLVNTGFNTFAFEDFNNDGRLDVVGSDLTSLKVFANLKSGYTSVVDTALAATSLLTFDLDKNTYHDLIFEGKSPSGKRAFTALYFGDRFSRLKNVTIDSTLGVLSAGDLNTAGYFDVVASQIYATKSGRLGIYQNTGTQLQLQKSFAPIDSADLLVADFNSDGKADISLKGNRSGLINQINRSIGDSIQVPSIHLSVQDYGDFDRDGDLDLVQVRQDSLVLLLNATATTNQGPQPVANSMSLPIFNRTFFYWARPLDDHTDSLSLSYDINITGLSGTLESAEFDQKKTQRLLRTHGNMGLNNYALLHVSNISQFQIQSIDNSFAVQPSLSNSSVCKNQVNQSTITVCDKSKPAVLTPAAPKAMWFSFQRGFIGIHDNVQQATADTLFSFNPIQKGSCGNVMIYVVNTSVNDTIKITKNKWKCPGNAVTLSVDNQWTSVKWSATDVTHINANSISVTGHTPGTILATAQNAQGCFLKETFQLHLSQPVLQTAPTDAKILSGESVQLSVSGALHYQWSPAIGLNNDTLASPTASPPKTTVYTVVGRDSVGCTATGTVKVEVIETGFLPELFSPNGDGKNDQLKIYGLSTVQQFKFSIYNREGNVVYQTQDLAEAVNEGWSGQAHGQLQPPGVYYWHVEGQSATGVPLQLNQKKSGIVVLVR